VHSDCTNKKVKHYCKRTAPTERIHAAGIPMLVYSADADLRRRHENLAAMSRRCCFALDLVADVALIEEYRRMHEPGAVWPGVIDHIRALGVEAMEIWQRGEHLFMILEAAEDFPRAVDAQALVADNLRWERLMDRFQRRLADAAPGEKWSPLERIFLLSEHSGTLAST
jgi:L-rhamnose mutarotase